MMVKRGLAAVGEMCRPRVEGDREAEILDATLDLLIEHGYDRLTMDAVASKAKASKATLYRRWETKPTLVIDAVIRAKGAPQMPDVDTGSLRGDLMATFCGHKGSAEAIAKGTQVMAALITAINTDPELGAEFRARFVEPKMATTSLIYQRAKDRGELGPDCDPSVLGPALAGILLHRTYVMGEPVSEDLVRQVIDTIILPAAACDLSTRTSKE
ncbi:MAG: TetR/AcrR family transcriptional regulator [Nocardioidaceae bacterium]